MQAMVSSGYMWLEAWLHITVKMFATPIEGRGNCRQVRVKMLIIIVESVLLFELNDPLY